MLVVSDAGMPLISDPGYRLVAACAEAGLTVSCLPGPSAVTTALAVSGLPSDRFCFEGFAPRKHSARVDVAGDAGAPSDAPACSSSRRAGWRSACATPSTRSGADRRAVVCRELTKTHEEVKRGTLAELAEWAADGVLGEITVVLAGRAAAQPTSTTLVAEVNALVDAGVRRQGRVREVIAANPGAPSRRELYDAVLRARS